MENKLFYKVKAAAFEEALPLGNGAFGGMVYGDIQNEKISLNLDTLWNGKPSVEPQADKTEQYRLLQQLIREGKIFEADRHLEHNIGRPQSCAYLPMGNLFIQNNGCYEGEYVRSLDLEASVAATQIKGDKGVKYEYLFSYPHNCLAIKISSKIKTDIKISFASLLYNEQSFENGVFTVKGAAADKLVGVDSIINSGVLDDSEKTVKFVMACAFICDKQPTYSNGVVSFDGVDELVILASASTTYIDHLTLMPLKACIDKTQNTLAAAVAAGYTDIKEAHINDVKGLYNKTILNLVDKQSEIDTLTRLKNPSGDVGLCELLFNYAKYLTIASSRPGSQATNLQGIWNEHEKAPWSSNYTVNINTEMNYWPTLMMGLDECYEPLVGLVEKISMTGKETAKKVYGAEGFVCHHNIDLWGYTEATGSYNGSACHCYWSMGSGWLARMLFDYYEYTLDEDYLKNTALPIMKEAARFYLDILTEHDGQLVIYPSTSPENKYQLIEDGDRLASSAYTCMSQSICADLFRCIIKGLEITGDDEQFKSRLEAVLPKVEFFKIDSRGRLIEFDDEYFEPEPLHRHVSHLYGLFPGEIISEGKNPEIVQAVRKSLEARGMAGTGWSMGWKTNLWAKLKDSEKAMHFIKSLLTHIPESWDGKFSQGGGVYTNLFDAHPPFQIDGNFGAASGIALMLVQKEDGIIKLLPALPKELSSGSLYGMKLKGGISLDMTWCDGKVTSAFLTTKKDCTQKVLCDGKLTEVTLKSGERIKII